MDTLQFSWIFVSVICTHAPIKICWYKRLNCEGARPEKKASNLTLFQKFQTQNLEFWIFSENFFRNELHAPFLPCFDTHIFICDKIISQGPKGVNSLSKFLQISKHICFFFLFRNQSCYLYIRIYRLMRGGCSH